MKDLIQLLRQRVKDKGVLPFAQFMELALYYPGLGYYERPRPQTGRGGDYYTSVSVGSLLGELLAAQFIEWQRVQPGGTFQVLETGAHDGRLAVDILTFLSGTDERLPGATFHEPGWGRLVPKILRQPTAVGDEPSPLRFMDLMHGTGPMGVSNEPRGSGAQIAKRERMSSTINTRARNPLFDAMEYWILEPSARRQEWQKANLERFLDRIRWFKDWADLPVGGVSGVIFANELLDAFPVHRLGWDIINRSWFEWGVALETERFVWAKLPWVCAAQGAGEVSGQDLLTALEAVSTAIKNSPWHWPAELLAVLPDGFTTEICPAAAHWWGQAAQALRQGKLLTLDYGLSAEQFILPERAGGTLKAYRGHQLCPDPLAFPGEQDLTAPVHFSELAAMGESYGLQTEGLFTQEQFLIRIMQKAWRAPEFCGSWNDTRVRQFKTLTHPDHLGRSFKVLVQSRTL